MLVVWLNVLPSCFWFLSEAGDSWADECENGISIRNLRSSAKIIEKSKEMNGQGNYTGQCNRPAGGKRSPGQGDMSFSRLSAGTVQEQVRINKTGFCQKGRPTQ